MRTVTSQETRGGLSSLHDGIEVQYGEPLTQSVSPSPAGSCDRNDRGRGLMTAAGFLKEYISGRLQKGSAMVRLL